MPVPAVIANIDKQELKKNSAKLAKTLVVNIVLGVTVAVAVSLISGVILNAISPTTDETGE